ncbi:MAG: tetraacyldisaccharide 4'-kinase [Firmicutes bacterium]|nr:tetraacyldisaccharide 4'-kinase [Bacillota bacterium]
MKRRKLESYLLRVISKEVTGLVPFLITGLLNVLEIVYLLLLKLQRSMVKRAGLLAPVISVGNLVAGGTGKTPTVVWLVNFLKECGYTPAVLTRGYRGGVGAEGLLLTRSELEKYTPDFTGDEPYLLAYLLPGTVIAVGRDRYRTALKALTHHPEIDILVMDDGFQYWKLERDLDILLLDATRPFGNGHLLPRGTLREPIAGLKRAGVILLTRTAQMDPAEIAKIAEYLRQYHPDAPVGVVREEHSALIPLGSRRQEDDAHPAANYLNGKKVAAITAIGNPRQFLASLESLGAEVGYFKSYPDHYQWEESEIENLIATLKDWGFEDLIVTGKDGVKLAAYLEKFRRRGLNCLMLSLEYMIDDEKVRSRIAEVSPRKVVAEPCAF